MAKQFFLHLIAFLFITNLFSQEYTFLKEIKLDIEAENYLTDQLGNVYLLHKDRIIKHDLNNNNEYEYSNNEMGSISYVDVSDPLRILIYYNDFNQIVFLDNKLSEIGSPVSLDDIGHENTNIVCSSKDGGFWLFDHQNGQLFYYNEDLNMVNQSVSINSITDEEINPNYMIEKNQSVYLNIPDYGILVFNQYGGFEHTIPLINLSEFQVINNRLIYYEDQSIIKFNPDLQLSESINLPDSSGIVNTKIVNNKLYLFKKNKFKIYNINQP